MKTQTTGTTHTPGPWNVNGPSGLIVTFDDTQSVALANHERCQVFAKVAGETQAQANARLIAAAPELLEALEVVANRLEQVLRLHHRGEDAKVLDRALSVHPDLCQARAAIAKATHA